MYATMRPVCGRAWLRNFSNMWLVWYVKATTEWLFFSKCALLGRKSPFLETSLQNPKIPDKIQVVACSFVSISPTVLYCKQVSACRLSVVVDEWWKKYCLACAYAITLEFSYSFHFSVTNSLTPPSFLALYFSDIVWKQFSL